VRIVLGVPLVVAATGIVGVFCFTHRGISEPTAETRIARYVQELQAIAVEVPLQIDPAPNWTQQAQVSLASVKANIQTTESIARDVEQQLATKSSGCIFAKAAGDAIAKGITPARAATQNALDALLSETNDRIKHLTDEDKALGWTGWKGSREEQIFKLALLAHDVETTVAVADLALTRLQDNGTALNRMTAACP
jgi:hypothetical protein